MILQSISNGLATFLLSADDCVLLSKAIDAGDPPDLQGSESDTLMAMGAAFKGAAIAGLSQFNMHVQDLEASDKAVKAAGLA